MTLDKTWFTEICAEAGSAFSLKTKEKLHSEKTQYQTIDIYATERWGNLMVIDGFVMLTDRENAIYHEMLSHPVLYTHKAPKRVLIIGGGDCGTLTEVLKHDNVQEATLVEIDERVTELSKQYFPSLTASLSDPRARVIHDDGVAWVKKERDLDIIIIDSTDPIGPAKALFGADFYRNCHAALAPGGIIVQQSESPLLHMGIIEPMYQAFADAGFASMQTLHFFQACYPSGWWTCTMAAKDATVALNEFDDAAARNKSYETYYYNADMHRASFAAPEFFRKALKL